MDIILKNRIGSDSQKTLSDYFWCVDRILFFFIRPPAASNRIRSDVFFPATGSGLGFVYTGKTLLVVCLTYIYPDSYRSRIACV